MRKDFNSGIESNRPNEVTIRKVNRFTLINHQKVWELETDIICNKCHRQMSNNPLNKKEYFCDNCNNVFVLPVEKSTGAYNSKNYAVICKPEQQSNIKPKRTNSKLTYRKLINIINKSLDTDKELSHSSIAQVNVNTSTLSFIGSKDSICSKVNYV